MTTIDTLQYNDARDKQLTRLAKRLAPAANEYVIERTVAGAGQVQTKVMFDAIVDAAGKLSRADAQKYHAWLTKSNYMVWMANAGLVEPEDRQPFKGHGVVSKTINGEEMSPMWVVISIGLIADSAPGEVLRARVVEALGKVITQPSGDGEAK